MLYVLVQLQWKPGKTCVVCFPGIYEVGVHIADVGHFVQPKTKLDQVASDRATSVYLVQKVSRLSNCVDLPSQEVLPWWGAGRV